MSRKVNTDTCTAKKFRFTKPSAEVAYGNIPHATTELLKKLTKNIVQYKGLHRISYGLRREAIKALEVPH